MVLTFVARDHLQHTGEKSHGAGYCLLECCEVSQGAAKNRNDQCQQMEQGCQVRRRSSQEAEVTKDGMTSYPSSGGSPRHRALLSSQRSNVSGLGVRGLQPLFLTGTCGLVLGVRWQLGPSSHSATLRPCTCPVLYPCSLAYTSLCQTLQFQAGKNKTGKEKVMSFGKNNSATLGTEEFWVNFNMPGGEMIRPCRTELLR